MKCWTLIVVLSAPSNFRLLTSESDDHEPSKHVLNELSSTTESLRQVSLEKNAAPKLISELTLSVSHPIPSVVIKTDYPWTMFMTTWDELYQMYGSHIERSILMEGFVCNTSLMHAVYVDSNRLN